jgi:hypothetical protein
MASPERVSVALGSMRAMSMHRHLRAVPADEVREDWKWLEGLFLESFHQLEEEYEADVDAEHPVHSGGTLVFAPDTESWNPPPFVVMPPGDVARAAAFLDDLDIEAHWAAARKPVLDPYVGWEDPVPQVRSWMMNLHSGVRVFYERAAHRGDAVAKWLWC